MKKINKNKLFLIYFPIGIVILFFLWWGLSAIIKSTLFPSPIEVIPTSIYFLGKGYTYVAIGGTFLRILISFLISFIVGLILGVLAGNFYRFEIIMKPIMSFFRSIPTAAIVLVLIVLFKPYWTPIIVTCLVMTPLFYEAFLTGIKNINSNIKDEMKMDGSSIFNSLFKIHIPIIYPYVLLAIVQSFGLGMKVSIMAEILGGSNEISGLGRLIQAEYMDANAKNVLAYSLIAILIVVIIDFILMFVKKRLSKRI